MNKILTAEEFFKEKYGIADRISTNNAILLAIEFAKLHIKAALEAAKVITDEFEGHNDLNQAILNAYPLTNIV